VESTEALTPIGTSITIGRWVTMDSTVSGD
jgi:hypothetical protein